MSHPIRSWTALPCHVGPVGSELIRPHRVVLVKSHRFASRRVVTRHIPPNLIVPGHSGSHLVGLNTTDRIEPHPIATGPIVSHRILSDRCASYPVGLVASHRIGPRHNTSDLTKSCWSNRAKPSLIASDPIRPRHNSSRRYPFLVYNAGRTAP